MKLTKSFTKTGEFFIEDERYQGTLSYEPKNGLFLNLKNLPLQQNYKPSRLMTGIIDGKPYSCTLLDLYPQGDVFSGNPDGFTRTSKFTVQAVLFGKRITDYEKLAFNQVKFAYSNFREWLNKPTVFPNLTYEDTKDDSIQLKKFPNITGSLNESFDFEIEIRNTGSFGSMNGNFDISLEQYVTFGIIGKAGKSFPLSNYLKLNKSIKYFFMFLQGRYVVEENIYCHRETDNQQAHEPILNLFLFQRRLKQVKDFDKVNDRFSHPYTQPIFERILQNWIKKYEEMPDFFDKFFENWIKEDLSPIDKFENLYHALMFYYKYNFEETIQSEEDYTSFFNTLQNKLDKFEKEFVEKFRVQGNKTSLRKQLNKVFEQLEYLKDKKSRQAYVHDVVDLRNRIQHTTEAIGPELLRDASHRAANLQSFTTGLILHEIEYEKNE